MTERERLIQFIKQKQNSGYKIGACQMDEIHCSNAELADYLLAIGVTILPCRVGDILYYHNLKDDECYKGEPISKWNIIENTVCEIRITKKGMIVIMSSGRMFTYKDFGKIIFHTKEEAEKVLAERNGE